MSRFEGSVWGQLVNSFVCSLMVIFSLGIATPWAIVYRQRWVAENTVIDGQRLEFEGTGGSLFFQWIKWLFLTLITFGIYSLWVNIKMQQWITEHTHFVA